MFYYSTQNLINEDTLPPDDATYRSSEDSVYQVENLYNYRPSMPFRFTGKTSEWVKIDLGAATDVSLFCVFNHKMTSGAAQELYSSADDTVYSLIKALTYRSNDEYIVFNVNDRWFKYQVTDAGNPNPLTIGELWLGNWSKFSNARIQSPRSDGPQFWVKEHVSPFGQDYDAFLSENELFSINFMNINDVSSIDEIQTFLSSVFENGNRFVMIPDHGQPHVYFCKILNKQNYATRLIYGPSKELRSWKIDVKTLSRGITLL